MSALAQGGRCQPCCPGGLPLALASSVWHRLEFRAQRGHFVLLDQVWALAVGTAVVPEP